jgi:CheY-like chemotaxis protein
MMPYVLIVDDDQAMRQLLTMALEDEGYCVQAAHSVGEALAIAQQGQPALVLFDMLLADGDGAEFVARYRQLPDARAMLIAVSGIANLEAEAVRIGADGYLGKPFDLDDVFSMVARALPDQTARDASA